MGRTFRNGPKPSRYIRPQASRDDELELRNSYGIIQPHRVDRKYDAPSLADYATLKVKRQKGCKESRHWTRYKTPYSQVVKVPDKMTHIHVVEKGCDREKWYKLSGLKTFDLGPHFYQSEILFYAKEPARPAQIKSYRYDLGSNYALSSLECDGDVRVTRDGDRGSVLYQPGLKARYVISTKPVRNVHFKGASPELRPRTYVKDYYDVKALRMTYTDGTQYWKRWRQSPKSRVHRKRDLCKREIPE